MKYDVVVVGGGTAGCAAAYTLGKAGKKVLIIEKNVHLGGTMTSALVTPMMKTSENQINTDFFNSFILALKKYNGQITYVDGNKGWFNPELAKIALDDLMTDANIDVIYNSVVEAINISNRYIKELQVKNESLSVCIGAIAVVDATGNCEIGKILNCNFLESKSEKQPKNLRFIMSGIDLKTFSDWIIDFDNDRSVTTSAVIDGQIHLSTAYTWDAGKKWALKPLFDKAVAAGDLKDEDRNYFQIFTIPNMPDSIAFNCPRIIESDTTPRDEGIFENSKALICGRASIFRIANFCKKYLKGFENAYISNIADMLGVRVSRRIKGKYIYTIDDLKSGKTFENPVLISNYPIDIHSTKAGKSVLEHTEKEYQLPVEALISADIDNLFVIGRCLSADFYAQAALRIIPSCFSMGEGVAKYILKNI